MLRGGFGIFVGPGQTEDQIQPIEAERISTTLTSGPLLAYPIDPAASAPTSPPTRTTARISRAPTPTTTRCRSGSTSTPRRSSRSCGGGIAATVAYVGTQGRNLFLRSIANRTIGVQSNGASAATQIREFDIVTLRRRRPHRRRSSGPYAEIDYKTSGGHDSYNALQLALTRRSAKGLVDERAVHARLQHGARPAARTKRAPSGNNARDLGDFDYDDGYNNFDVRHTFNLSALYTHSRARVRCAGGWSVGGIVNARSGVPINVLITRPDIVYVDGAGDRVERAGG